MANTFEYFTRLKGFHVYSNMVNWKPLIVNMACNRVLTPPVKVAHQKLVTPQS